MRQIILDTETTGLDPNKGHRIIEIGCIELLNRQFTKRHFHHYLQPERDIDPGAQAVHGISSEFLKDKPVFAKIADELIAFLSGAELIIHNAPFDIGFLDRELSLLAYPQRINDFCTVTDTLVLAKQLYPGQRNSLDALCKRLEIDNSHRELHGALLDSQLLAEVYLRMTGGQATLFSEDTSLAPTTKTTVESATTKIHHYDLAILRANAEELAAHEKKLNEMEKAQACLWREWEKG